MGYFSDRAIRENEGPKISRLNKSVCAECVVDDELKVLVAENLSSVACDYCGEEGEGFVAAPFDKIMKRICGAVLEEYADAQDTDMPWVEGGWLEEQIFVEEVLASFDPGWGRFFFNDVASCFDPNIYWVQHSGGAWATDDPSEALRYGWESFKYQVLAKTRYLFLAEPEDEFLSGRPDYIPVARMLDALGAVCLQEGLVTVVPAGTEFYRVRHAPKKSSKFTTFSEMGVPPVGVASAGRMNPAGISYLYLAYSRDTAEKEVLEWSKRWFFAKFRSKVDLVVVDFSNLPELPSMFKPASYTTRHNRYFLHSFVRDLVAPVVKDGREHVDYVPTQIVSEYFRYKFKTGKGDNIRGIKYSSVKDAGGTNLAIFLSDNDELESLFELVAVDECRA